MSKKQLRQEDLEVQKLTKDNLHLIAGFVSSVCVELEAFLKENAWNESCLDFSKTYLFLHKGTLAGYATLLTDKQTLANGTEPLLPFQEKAEYSSIPALKIGRLCVADNYNSQLQASQYSGLGKIIFASILDHAQDLKTKVGCRVITTHAKKATGAHIWYKKLGFLYSHNDEKVKESLAKENVDAVPMFYDINRIIK